MSSEINSILFQHHFKRSAKFRRDQYVTLQASESRLYQDPVPKGSSQKAWHRLTQLHRDRRMAPTWRVAELGAPILIRAIYTVLLPITQVLLGHTSSTITAGHMCTRTGQMENRGQGVLRAGPVGWGRYHYPCGTV